MERWQITGFSGWNFLGRWTYPSRNLSPPLTRWSGKENAMPTPEDRNDEPIHKRRNRAIFIAGLVGFALLALVFGLLG